MTADLALVALTKAAAWQPLAAGLLLHSDRGAQYGSGIYRDFIARLGFAGSMSGRGCCCDNAKVERFFGTLKDLAGGGQDADWARRDA